MLTLSLWLSNLANAANGRARSLARPRAASLLEYVLLAAVVLVAVAAFAAFFGESVGELLIKLKDAITDAGKGADKAK